MSSIQLKTKIPGPKSIALMERRIANVPRGPFHTAPVFIKSARGALITDVDDNTFIDFAAGIGVTNVGHCAENVISDIRTQADNFLHAGFNVTPYESYIQLCEKLNAAVPGNFAKKTFLANSGAEAVENAVKIARSYTKRQGVICFSHAFHGRTYLAMTLTSKAKPYKQGFMPFMPEIYRAPYPYSYRWPTGEDSAQVSAECFQALEELVTQQVLVENTACVILEPVLGEGGFVAAPKEFLQKLSSFCKTHGIVLIADEIQTGFGRTGKLFCSEHYPEFTPDILISAKGLGGGLPISAVTGRAEIMDAPDVGAIGGTFGGNPLSCAAALAVFKTFEDGKFLEHVQTVGEALWQRLAHWRENFSVVGDIRGIKPMCAMELVRDRKTKQPYPEATKQLVKYAYEHGVITMGSGTFGNVLRFLMPLTIRMEELQTGLDVIENGLKELDHQGR